MTIGKIEIFLILVLIGGAAWMGAQYLPLGAGMGACTPVPLTPEVKAYVDTKIAAGNGPLCGEVPKVISRVVELESRMGELDKYRKMREEVEDKRQELEQALAEQRQEQNQVLAKVRASEIDSLKTEVGRLCAGITVRASEPEVDKPAGTGPNDPALIKDGPPGETRRERRLRKIAERAAAKAAANPAGGAAPAAPAAAAPAAGAVAPAAPGTSPAAAPAPGAPAAPEGANGQPK